MTRLMEKALEAIRELPEAEQDELARMILEATGQAPGYDPTPAEMEAIEEGLADADAGRFATDAEVAAAFGRFARQ